MFENDENDLFEYEHTNNIAKNKIIYFNEFL
jgi:hypothetical protein